MTTKDYQAPVVVLGVTETVRALDELPVLVRFGIRQELNAAAHQIASMGRSFVDPQGLSGWGKWKGGYSPASIAAGIKVTRMAERGERSSVTRSYIGVINSTAAGAIWEVAGRKSDGKPPRKGRRRKRIKVDGHYQDAGAGKAYGNGQAFVAGIRKRGGDASRTIWAAYDLSDAGAIRHRIEQMVVRSGRTTQAAIDRNAY